MLQKFAAAVLASTLALPVWADVVEEEQHTFTLADGGRISVDNVNGDIDVTGHDGNQVEILAVKRAGEQEYLDGIEVIIDASDDHISIETRHPKKNGMFGWFKDSSGSVSYTLSVPNSANLDAIDTVNGDIDIAGVAGHVRADTVNGDVEARGLRGNFVGDTVNGSVFASFETVGEGQRIVGDSVNGRITFELPADANADVRVETVNGSIDGDDFGLEVDKGFVGRDLSGQIGSGGAKITADTVNGGVRIRQR